jgi:hypothetical protein
VKQTHAAIQIVHNIELLRDQPIRLIVTKPQFLEETTEAGNNYLRRFTED